MKRDLEHTFELLSDFGDKVVAKAQQNLEKKRSKKTRRGYATKRSTNASGRLSRSLFWGFDRTAPSFNFGASGKAGKYAQYVEHGRGPGKQPPLRSILNWIKIKPLRPRDLTSGKFIKKTPATLESMAYLIARKIGRYGTEATNFYTDAFIEEYKKLDKNIQDVFAADVELTIDAALSSLDNLKIG
tara:strand:- start:2803 stop:3360 length:558 start_codon:yes stop_codon:yes gene_type:complete